MATCLVIVLKAVEEAVVAVEVVVAIVIVTIADRMVRNFFSLGWGHGLLPSFFPLLFMAKGDN